MEKKKSTKSKNQKRYFEFKLPCMKDQRPQILTIPEDKIESIKTQFGSQEVYCVVNGIQVQGSYNDLLKKLGTVIKCYRED